MLKSAVLAIGLCVAVAVVPARADVVTDWNKTAIDVMKAANITGNPLSRAMAMVHVAMADAVNSVEGRYTLYAAQGPAVRSASAEAAAITAARHILVHLAPAKKAMIDEAYAAALKAIPDGGAKAEGVSLGERVAAAVIADRAADATNVRETYRPITTPGVWVPTTLPLAPQYAKAKPWVMTSASQFRPGPPPALSSALYARDYNETKTLGGANSTARTAEQTQAVKFWPGGSFALGWYAAANQLSAAKGLTLAENARLFALLAMGIANTFIADWDAKFAYNFWRPITAIRNGDLDGNDATERDPGWTPLNATPIHPEYPSQASIVAGVAMGVLEAVFGPQPQLSIVVTGAADPKLTRKFKNIAEMSEEHKNVRVWGGIHFRNSLEVAQDMGRKIAAYLVENAIKPTR